MKFECFLSSHTVLLTMISVHWTRLGPSMPSLSHLMDTEPNTRLHRWIWILERSPNLDPAPTCSWQAGINWISAVSRGRHRESSLGEDVTSVTSALVTSVPATGYVKKLALCCWQSWTNAGALLGWIVSPSSGTAQESQTGLVWCQHQSRNLYYLHGAAYHVLLKTIWRYSSCKMS